MATIYNLFVSTTIGHQSTSGIDLNCLFVDCYQSKKIIAVKKEVDRKKTKLTWKQSCNQLDDKGRVPSESQSLVDFVFDCCSK